MVRQKRKTTIWPNKTLLFGIYICLSPIIPYKVQIPTWHCDTLHPSLCVYYTTTVAYDSVHYVSLPCLFSIGPGSEKLKCRWFQDSLPSFHPDETQGLFSFKPLLERPIEKTAWVRMYREPNKRCARISFLRPGVPDFIRAHHTIRAASVCFALASEPAISKMQQRIQFHTRRATLKPFPFVNRSLKLLYIFTINTKRNAASVSLKEVS